MYWTLPTSSRETCRAMREHLSRIEGERIAVASPVAACNRCGNILRVLQLFRTNESGERRRMVRLCAECLADALEVATGYGITKQMGHWDSFAAVSSELAAASHVSRKAKQKRAERESARQHIIDKGF